MVARSGEGVSGRRGRRTKREEWDESESLRIARAPRDPKTRWRRALTLKSSIAAADENVISRLTAARFMTSAGTRASTSSLRHAEGHACFSHIISPVSASRMFIARLRASRGGWSWGRASDGGTGEGGGGGGGGGGRRAMNMLRLDSTRSRFDLFERRRRERTSRTRPRSPFAPRPPRPGTTP